MTLVNGKRCKSMQSFWRYRLSRLGRQISTKFQRLYEFFGVKQSNEDSGNVVRSNGMKPEVANWRFWTSNTYTSACTQVRQQLNSNDCTYVYGVRDYQIWIVVIFYGQTGSGKLKIAASKLSACTLDNNEIPTAKQMFRGRNIKWG